MPSSLIAAIFAPILSSIAWLTQAASIELLSPISFLAYAPLTASLILGSYLYLKKTLPKRELLYKYKKDLLFLLIIRYVAAYIIFAYALQLTQVSKVIFLTKVEPYMVIFWYWVLHGKKVTPYHLILLAVHIGGAIFLSTGGIFHVDTDQWGDLLILIATGLASLSYVPAQKLSHVIGSTQTTFIGQGLSGLIFLPFALYFDPKVFSFTENVILGWEQLLLTVLLFHVLSSVLWYHSLKGVAPWLISALRCVGPLVAAPIAWIFLNQPLNNIQIIGAVIVLITSVMMVKAKDETTQLQEK